MIYCFHSTVYESSSRLDHSKFLKLTITHTRRGFCTNTYELPSLFCNKRSAGAEMMSASCTPVRRHCGRAVPGMKYFARSKSEVVGSKTAQGMDVCVYSALMCRCWPYVGLIHRLRSPTGSLRLRNWSETKRFTDVLWSKVGATGRDTDTSR
jgi:hypothetical protein